MSKRFRRLVSTPLVGSVGVHRQGKSAASAIPSNPPSKLQRFWFSRYTRDRWDDTVRRRESFEASERVDIGVPDGDDGWLDDGAASAHLPLRDAEACCMGGSAVGVTSVLRERLGEEIAEEALPVAQRARLDYAPATNICVHLPATSVFAHPAGSGRAV